MRHTPLLTPRFPISQEKILHSLARGERPVAVGGDDDALPRVDEWGEYGGYGGYVFRPGGLAGGGADGGQDRGGGGVA